TALVATRLLRPGHLAALPFSVTADTKVSAEIRAKNGRAVRVLGQHYAVGRGSHTVTWDGLGQSGKPARDGRYTLQLQSVDPYGNEGSAVIPIVLDSEPPRATVL